MTGRIATELRRTSIAAVVRSGLLAIGATVLVFEAVTDRDWAVTDWEWPEIATIALLVTLALVGLHATPRAQRLERRATSAIRVLPFWARTPLYRWTPGGFGYYRTLRRLQDATYDDIRDRHPVRLKHRGAQALQEPDAEGLVKRDYDTYSEYVLHQRQKLDAMLKVGAFANREVADMRRRFYRRFRVLIGLVPADATILCLGARQGTEVEVLRDLGFCRAMGIDLNPGPWNPNVRVGDFHHLPYADSSIDVVYSNSLDHAFDLDSFFAEHARVLRPHGLALYDIQGVYRFGDKAPFEATLWERREDVLVRAMQYFQRLLRVETDHDWTWALLQDARR